jgi:hypothetical protein
MKTRKTKDARVITIAIDLANGRYEGPAKVIDEAKHVVAFPWQGEAWHQCWLSDSEWNRAISASCPG